MVFFRGRFSTKFWFNRTSKIGAVEGVSKNTDESTLKLSFFFSHFPFSFQNESMFHILWFDLKVQLKSVKRAGSLYTF